MSIFCHTKSQFQSQSSTLFEVLTSSQSKTSQIKRLTSQLIYFHMGSFLLLNISTYSQKHLCIQTSEEFKRLKSILYEILSEISIFFVFVGYFILLMGKNLQKYLYNIIGPTYTFCMSKTDVR